MKKLVIVLLVLMSVQVSAQLNPGIGSRLFNHSLAYGPRNYNTFYSVGYGFNSKNSISSIELGHRPISLGIYLVQSDPFVLNSQPVNFYYLINYVYQNKKMRRLFISGGVGPSIYKTYNGMVGKVGVDFRIVNPIYLSLHTFQEMYRDGNTNLTLGAKIYLF